MGKLDISSWVEAEKDPARREFRQAMHLFLRAVASSADLTSVMVMKGGILLAIRYQSSRYTKDVDFSTSRRMQEVNIPTFLHSIGQALAFVSIENEYGLALATQSHFVNPRNRPEADFPTLQLGIGYAAKNKTKEIERLKAAQSPKVIRVDYSFNEWASEAESREMDGGVLNMYAFHDLIAEKIRSVLQQPLRNRERYQDIYDLYLLLNTTTADTSDKKLFWKNCMRPAMKEKFLYLRKHFNKRMS